MRRPRGLRQWLVALALLFAPGGCAPVEDWRVFEVDFQERLRKQPDRPVEVPEALQPSSETDPTFNLTLPPPGEPIALSIEQATFVALGRNRDLRVQQLSPVIVGAFEQIERGVFDPELFAEGRTGESSARETARATGEQFSVEARSASGVGGIRQFLPTGTTIEGTVEQARDISNRSPEQQEARLGLTVTQSLLRGFGPAVNLVSIRQAQLDTLASVYELRGFTEALLAETEIAYWNFVLAREEIAIFERSLEIAIRQRDEVEQQIDVGLMPQTEAAATRAEVALREQALINARSELESSRVRLIRLLNPADDSNFEREVLAVTDPRLEAMAIDDLGERVQLADTMRPDLGEARLRLEQDRLETIVTRNGLMPRLDLFIALGKSGFGDTLSGSFQDLDTDSDDWTAGVSLSHYLGNRAARGRDLAARATRQQSAAAVANLRQLVQTEVRLAVIEAERARQQIQASAATRFLQEQTVRAEEERYDVGASTSLLVAQAQRDLLLAQIAEVEAIVQYRIALVSLYLAEGSLLERRGIRLAGSEGRVAGGE